MESVLQETLQETLASKIKRHARTLGFDLCRIVPMGEAAHAEFFESWLDKGRAGEMTYLERNVEKRRDPRELAEPDTPPLRSLIVLAVNHHQFDLPETVRQDRSRGLIASYAWGEDYHEVVRPRLHDLDAMIRNDSGRTTLGKALVDSGPVLERDWAGRAGIGFFGKNCCTIRPRLGSWLLLATLGVPEVLDYDAPPQFDGPPQPDAELVLRGLPPAGKVGAWRLPGTDESGEGESIGGCGRCTRCMDGCPTDAFVGPFHLDPQRCISYWTIETRSPVPRDLRPLFGNRIFGCDICQEVCPWNRLPGPEGSPRAPAMPELVARAEWIAPPLLEGFDPANPYWLDDEAFRVRFRRSPVRRAKRHGMLRNVCVALGNWAAAEPARDEVLDALAVALADAQPAARGHAAWALGQARTRRHDGRAEAWLADALSREEDAWVADEIRAALVTS